MFCLFVIFFLEGNERNGIIEISGMVLYIFNEYKNIFFLSKKRNCNRFLRLFHGLQFSIGGKDPGRNS